MGANSSKQSCTDYLEEETSSEEESENDERHQSVANSQIHYANLDGTDNNCFDSATDTTDAIPPNATMTIALTLEQVTVIENTLDINEKVSVLFLLINDPNLALNWITKLIENNNETFIYRWAYKQTANKKWSETLVEAICIIQNYEVLRLLNFKREDLDLRFLPRHVFTSMYVNKIRKALYFVCESLIQDEVENMLRLLNFDFVKKELNYVNYDLQYLELHILHWEVVGYMHQNNLTNVCSILKQMGQLDLYELLKNLVPPKDKIKNNESQKIRTIDGKKSESVLNEILNPSSSLLKLASIGSTTSSDNIEATKCENKYSIDPNNPGVCLVINQENFYRDVEPAFKHLLPSLETKLEPRTGTEYDKAKIQETFSRFGYKIITVDNLVHSDIIKKIEEVMMDITSESSLFVCILSHGDEGVVYGVNSCRISVKAIKHAMVTKNRKYLLGKPKVLILQSCQGTRCSKVSSTEEDEITTDSPTFSPKEVIAPWVDLFTFWATVPGYGAIRNKNTGSWFIQSLCDKMNKLASSHHFEDICTSVIADVSSKQWIKSKEPVAMVPLKDSTLRKPFYLPPLRDKKNFSA